MEGPLPALVDGGVAVGADVTPSTTWTGGAVGSDVAPWSDWTGINWACVEDAVGDGVGGSVGDGVGGSVGDGVGGSVGDGVGQAPPAHAAELLLLWSEAQRTNSVVTDAGVESELAPACIRTVVGLVNAASPAH